MNTSPSPFPMKFILLLSILLPAVSAFEYLVAVGKDETTGEKGMGFDPSVIFPDAGDVVVFQFRSGLHSVLQSTFTNPCTDMTGGYDSGVITTPDTAPVDSLDLPKVSMRVNNTDPLWFFDRAGGLCQKGAVFAINPSDAETPAQFKQNAVLYPAIPHSTITTATTGEPTANFTTLPITSRPSRPTPTNIAKPTTTRPSKENNAAEKNFLHDHFFLQVLATVPAAWLLPALVF